MLPCITYRWIECRIKLESTGYIKLSPLLFYLTSFISIGIIFVTSYIHKLQKVFRPINPSGLYHSKYFLDESSSPSDCSWGYQNSFTDNEDSQDLEKCLLSQIVEQDKPTIFLFGDSHSTSLASSVKKTSLNSNYNFAQASHVYCPFRKNYSMNWKVFH